MKGVSGSDEAAALQSDFQLLVFLSGHNFTALVLMASFSEKKL